MIKQEALRYVSRRFTENDGQFSTWSNDESGRTFQSLVDQLVDDYGLTPGAAVDILESAYYAAADEFLC
jgi:hypothetical protein